MYLKQLESMFLRVKPYYNESHRYYHNYGHPYTMIEFAEQNQVKLNMAQQLAIIFHDIVYIPGFQSNEEASCRLMEYVLKEFPQYEHLSWEIGNHIMSTRDHHPVYIDSKVVVDLDLMSLGSNWEMFQYNTGRIRQEYRGVNDSEWAEGRIEFMDNLLARPYIFHIDQFRTLFESQARSNLERSRNEFVAFLGR